MKYNDERNEDSSNPSISLSGRTCSWSNYYL